MTLHERIQPVSSIAPSTHAAAAAYSLAGAAVVKGNARVALVSLLFDAATVLSGYTVDVKIQGRTVNADTGAQGAWTDVTQEDGTTPLAFAQATFASHPNQFGLLYLGELPYDEYRAVSTVVGANGVGFSVNFTLGDYDQYPYKNVLTNVWASVHGVAARANA